MLANFKVFIMKIYIFLFIIIFGSLLYGKYSSENLILTNKGKSEYSIYCGKSENIIVKHAAEELADYINRISGNRISVTNNLDKSSKYIIVGKNNSFSKKIEKLIKFSLIKCDGFRIISHDGNIYIAGKIDRGTLYGVYYFLDHYLGVRWFSSDYEVIPKKEKIELPPINDLQNPDFAYREIFDGQTDDVYLRQHNRLNGCRFHRKYYNYPEYLNTWSNFVPGGPPPQFGGHNFYRVVKNEKYHYGGQLLAMDENCRKIAADYFKDVIKNYGTDYWYGFTQMDNGWQADSLSLEFAEKHGKTLAAPIADMVLSTADRVRKMYPAAKFATFAYQFSFLPPKNMDIPEYLLVETAPIHADFGQPFFDKRNKDVDEALRGWNAIAENLSIWTYNTNFQNYLQPLPNMYAMFEDIKYLAKFNSIKGYFGQGAYNTKGAEFADLRMWVASRLLWDNDADYKRLIDEFCDGYYGEASIYIKKYIKLLHESLDKTNERISSKQRITSKYLNLSFIMQADSLMAKTDLAAEGVYSKHVHQVRLGVDMTILLREHMYKADAESKGIKWRKDEGRLERFREYTQEAGIEEYSEDQKLENLFDVIAIKRINPSVPVKLVKGKAWIDYQDMDFNICCGAALVNDEMASDHGTVKYSGREWAVQMSLDKLPPGEEWNLYAIVRVEKNKNSAADETAFNMGVYPGKSKNIRIEDITDDRYQVYSFPGNPFSYQTGKNIWFVSGDGAQNIYIDRIIAVKNN
jgi:hypothetical protein